MKTKPWQLVAGGLTIVLLAYLTGSDYDPGARDGGVALGSALTVAGVVWWLAKGHYAEFRARRERKAAIPPAS